MSNSKKLFVVINAFSKQGISIINTLIEDGNYNIKAVSSRDASNNPIAIEWKSKVSSKNVEITFVKANITNEKEVEGLFEGAYGAFLMTPNLEYHDLELERKEYDYVKLQGDSALKSNVQHVIFSSVDILQPDASHKYHYDFMTNRKRVQTYLEQLPFPYVSIFLLSYFYSNNVEFNPPKPVIDDNGNSTDELIFPFAYSIDTKLPYIDTYTATGPTVLAFLKNPQEYNRKVVPLVSEWLSHREMCETFSKVTGIKVRPLEQTRQEYLDWNGFSGSEAGKLAGNRIFEIWEVSIREAYYPAHFDTTLFKRVIQPDAVTWEQWLQRTQWKGESYQEFRLKNNY